jgi:putative transcriptional regulator
MIIVNSSPSGILFPSVVNAFANHERANGTVSKAETDVRYTALEKGKYTPSLELAFRIARAFDVSLEEVFFLDEDKS